MSLKLTTYIGVPPNNTAYVPDSIYFVLYYKINIMLSLSKPHMPSKYQAQNRAYMTKARRKDKSKNTGNTKHNTYFYWIIYTYGNVFIGANL